MVNKTPWPDAQVYLTALGLKDGRWSFLRSDGSAAPINHLAKYDPGHLAKNGVSYPNMSFTLAQTSGRPVAVPPAFESARLWVSLGAPMYLGVADDDRGWAGPNPANPTDPNNDVPYEWSEFTNDAARSSFGINVTQVDQFTFPTTVRLQAPGFDRTVGMVGTRADAFAAYNASVGTPFRALAGPLRILAPRTSPLFGVGGAYGTYLDAPIAAAWSALGRTDAKPTTAQVFGCSGPVLATDAQLCAALNRGVATGDWRAVSGFYPAGVAHNDYAAFFHAASISGKAYGFAYDDVLDQSSYLATNAAGGKQVTMTVSW